MADDAKRFLEVFKQSHNGAKPNAAQMVMIAQEASQTWRIERTTTLVLLFGGKGEAATCIEAMGHVGMVLDIKYSALHDATELVGVFAGTYAVHTCVEFGTVWSSQECKTWLSYVSRHSFKRTKEDVYGPADNMHVEKQNTCAVVASWWLQLAHSRGCFTGNENPLNSLLHSEPCTSFTYAITNAARDVTRIAAFGSMHYKPLEIFTTIPQGLVQKHLVGSHAAARKRLTEHGFENGKGEALAVKRGRWTSGIQKKSQSEEYPREFALAIAQVAVESQQRYAKKDCMKEAGKKSLKETL